MEPKELVSPVLGQEYLVLISLQNILLRFRGSEILGDEQTTSLLVVGRRNSWEDYF